MNHIAKWRIQKSLFSQAALQVLRFSASNVAALCGYNPYTDWPEMFNRLLYQDLDGCTQYSNPCPAL